jgi:hypothetical protein
MARYLKDLPPPPESVDWTKGITEWGMMLNDNLGDCTIAACGHAIQVWTVNLGSQVTIPDSDILKAYEDWDGYNPSDPNTDQGGVEIDVLNSWRKQGLSAHTLLAYADPDPGDIVHVKQAINLFGGVYIGIGLPLTAQNQDIWDVVKMNWFKKLFRRSDPSEPNSWGGHAVFVPAYNSTGPICITWGQLKQMTWAFWQKYCDESHALLSPDWISTKSPSGFDLATLQTDLQSVAA